MKRIDFSNYKFRCSQLGELMTNGRGGNELGETAKSALQKIWIKEVYGRSREINSKEMEKGTEQEESALTLLTNYLEMKRGKKVLVIKNKRQLSNDWITGTPDITVPFVGDIKNPYDMETFPIFEDEVPNKSYFWQLGVGYAWLMNLKEGDSTKLIYTLTDLPLYLLEREKKFSKLYSMDPASEEYQKLEDKYDFNFSYSDIPIEEKVVIFDIPVDIKQRDVLKERIVLWRKYLNELTERRITYLNSN